MDFLATLGEERTLVPAVIAIAQWEITPEHLRSGDPNGSFIIWQATPQGWRGAPTFFRAVRQEASDAG